MEAFTSRLLDAPPDESSPYAASLILRVAEQLLEIVVSICISGVEETRLGGGKGISKSTHSLGTFVPHGGSEPVRSIGICS